MMELLEYEKEIFAESFTKDGLLIMSKGLGIERILFSILRLYCEPTHLVLVLNTTPHEEEYFRSLLSKINNSVLPKSVNADTSINERQKMYLEGGVLFVTTRILVVDMLVERIPISHITGIVVYRANRLIDSCHEAFILRLYRQKNKTGFIKALSENATAFTKGFCQIERTMKNLYLGNLYLWPRFRASVVDCFEKNKVDVVELHVPMTRLMMECQACLLDLIDSCLKEIKRCHTILDTEELTVEFALTKSFDKVLRLQLDPVWHQLSHKTRQIVSDLRLMRTLLGDLIQYDSVNFCSQIDTLRTNMKHFNSNVGWLFTESADRLLTYSRERIGLSKNNSSSSISVEMSPKWQALREVLQEIEQQSDDFLTQEKSLPEARVRVLVLGLDGKTCKQLSQYLSDAEVFAERLKENYKSSKIIQEPQGQHGRPPYKKWKFTEKTGSINSGGSSSAHLMGESEDEDGHVGTIFGQLDVKVHPLRDRDDPNDLTRKLNELRPHVVILYDTEVAAVRNIEVYKAADSECTLARVYFLMYKGSAEEQQYLTVLRREKESFESLIKQKATMVIPQEREGKHEEVEEPSPAPTNENTRKGWQASTDNAVIPRVVVDMREFRSELPSLLHKRGIMIDPITLEVGDYILTPDICVERKSVSDLIGSLNNGRLYNQCLAMCRTYKRPVLLIEFNPNKPFVLQDRYAPSNEINSGDVTSRLALLTLHFPKLRILWCQSPHATAELFEELKVGREQPKAEEAAMVTSASEERSEDQSEHLDKYNSTPQDMLAKMPGVNTKNIYLLMNKIENLSQLAQLTLEQLTDIMGNSQNAALLFEFLNATGVSSESSTKGQGDAQSNRKGPKQRFSLNKFGKKT